MRGQKLHLIKGIFIIALVMLCLSSFQQTHKLEYIYNLPEPELRMHLDESSGSFIGEILENSLSAYAVWVSGSSLIGELEITEEQEFQILVKTIVGEAKVALQSSSGSFLVVSAQDGNSHFLSADSYEVFCIGKHFCGSIKIVPIKSS